jgi:undecaprenyl-diphosphatase
VALILNGGLLWLGDRVKHRVATADLHELSYARAFGVGVAQSLALIPGFSRSGATLVAGLAAGLDYAASARFSFLLATPIIAAAGVLEVPKLIKAGAALPLGWMFAAGAIAGVCAWLSTAFLMRWFGGHEVKALRPFAIYCALLGMLALVVG